MALRDADAVAADVMVWASTAEPSPQREGEITIA